jgi:hypothetical protein
LRVKAAAASPFGLLEELPLDVAGVAEGNSRRARRVVMQIRGNHILVLVPWF